MTALRQRMLEDLRIRNYSPSTVRAYVRCVADFAEHFNKSPKKLGPEDIRSYQLFLLNEKRVKLSSYIQSICALRFLYQNTLRRRIEIDRIPLPRYEKKLPVILSKAEVKALLEAPKNLKHRAMLATMYGAGMRVSEVTKLKVSDLDRARRVIWVRGGKGHKDRQVMLWRSRSVRYCSPTGNGSVSPTGFSPHAAVVDGQQVPVGDRNPMRVPGQIFQDLFRPISSQLTPQARSGPTPPCLPSEVFHPAKSELKAGS